MNDSFDLVFASEFFELTDQSLNQSELFHRKCLTQFNWIVCSSAFASSAMFT